MLWAGACDEWACSSSQGSEHPREWYEVAGGPVSVLIGKGNERLLRRSHLAQQTNRIQSGGAPGSSTQLVLIGVYLQPEALSLLDGSLLKRLQADPRVA